MEGRDLYIRKSRRPYPWDSLQHYQLEKDILSDECDKDSGYEPDPVGFWAARNGGIPRGGPGFKRHGLQKQRSLEVEPVSGDYYSLLSPPRIGSEGGYYHYDPAQMDNSLYNQIRYQSLDRPVKRRRKVPESILKNPYNSLPRGSAGIVREEPFEGSHHGSQIGQSRNSVKFASPTHHRYSAASDNIDNGGLPYPIGSKAGSKLNLNLSLSTEKVGTENGEAVSQSKAFTQLNGNVGQGKKDQGAPPPLNSEASWPNGGSSTSKQPLTRPTSLTNGHTSFNGQHNGNSSSGGGPNKQQASNGNLKRYSDNDHYLRKSASVQIIAHEPSRCEGCFDGRLPLLLIVVFIGLVLFLLCVGVILDAEVFKDSGESESENLHQTTEGPPECLKLSCTFGAICRVENKEASCQCVFNCPKSVKPVCGSDGLTYDNDCERRKAQCRLKQSIDLAKTGPCIKDPCENVFCPSDQKCLPSFDGESARCVCKGPCTPEDNRMVCGGDGKDYTSLCHMEKESCTKQSNISLVFNGPCDPCKDVWCSDDRTCRVDAQREASCACVAPGSCLDIVTPVCASNGRTYRNQCTMKQDGCHLGLDLVVVHSGECKEDSVCERLLCSHLAQCGVGPPRACICPPCPPVYDPVCSRTNVTHKSECELYREACEDGVLPGETILAYHGVCREKPCSKSDCPAPYSRCGMGPDQDGLTAPTRCVCPSCPFHFTPVCGQDGVLYDNICLLQRAACLANKDIPRAPLNTCDMMRSSSTTTTRRTTTTQSTTTPSAAPPLPPIHTYATSWQPQTFQPSWQPLTPHPTLHQYEVFTEEPPWRHSFHPEEHDTFTRFDVSSVDEEEDEEEEVEEEQNLYYPEQFDFDREQHEKVEEYEDARDVSGHKDCSTKPCQGGGTCEAHDGTFTCYCTDGRGGRLCQNSLVGPSLRVPSFSGNSYLELDTLRHAEHKTSLYMEFRSTRSDGQLLYIEQEASRGKVGAGGRDFLSLSVLQGFVEFRYNLGSGPAILRSLRKIIPGQWHSVSVKRWHQDSILVLDNDPEVLGSVGGELKSLDLTSSTFIGWVPPLLEQAPANIGTSKGLVGCIRKVKLGHRTVRFHFELEPSFRTGSQVTECQEEGCLAVTCYNQGWCEERDGHAVCQCPAPYSGPQCEQATEVGGGDYGVSRDDLDDREEEPAWVPDCPQGDCHVPDFSRHSFLELPSLTNVAKYADIEVWFLTRALDGLLLYNGGKPSGGGDFISLNLVAGLLQLTYDLGSGLARIVSQRQVTLNTWHKVRFIRSGLEASLQVNSEPVVRGSSPPPMTSLNLGQPLMLGGYRHLYAVNAESGVVTGLDGAIQRLVVNGDAWTNIASRADDAMAMGTYQGPPCQNNPCRNGGTCVAHFRRLICVCRQGWRGRHCRQRDVLG